MGTELTGSLVVSDALLLACWGCWLAAALPRAGVFKGAVSAWEKGRTEPWRARQGNFPGGSGDVVRARLAHGKQVGDAKPAGEVRRRAEPLTPIDGRERPACLADAKG